MGSNPNPQPQFRTQIEQRFMAQLTAMGQALPRVTDPAWYFSASFANVDNNEPIGYLRRYDKDDQLLYPRAETIVPGKVVGDVRFAEGRAYFSGQGHIEFNITQEHTAALDQAKLDASFLAPKPLIMMASGQVDRAAYADAAFANPALFYRSGQSEFGLFVPDGSIVSKINLEVLRAATGQVPTHTGAAVWHAYIAQAYKRVQDGKRFRLAHDLMDSATLSVLSKREFFIYEPFQVPLNAGATVYVGHAPIAGATPFHGWIDEIIFDPTGGSSGGGGGDGKVEGI